jgi:hypothetical protein
VEGEREEIREKRKERRNMREEGEGKNFGKRARSSLNRVKCVGEI